MSMGQREDTRIATCGYTLSINPCYGRIDMKRLGLCVILCVIALAGISLGQDATDPLFTFERQIGQLRPSGIRYDPVFDRFVWVDLNGQLVLADAATLSLIHI